MVDSQGEGRVRKTMGERLQECNTYGMDQWRQIIQKCQESGLSNKAYCEQQGISEKAYYYWPRAVEQTAPQIIELEEERQGEMLYIRYRGAELTLPAKRI